MREKDEHLIKAELALTRHFSFAVTGSSCRTRSYRHNSNDKVTEWLVANFLFGQGWHMKRAVESDGFVSYEPLPDKQELKLFDVVQYLAIYEESQPELGFEQLDDDPNTYNPAYFRELARHEAIVFNRYGMPHPTDQGCIINDTESFAADAENEARGAYQKLSDFSLTPLPGAAFPQLTSETLDKTVFEDIQENTALAAKLGETKAALYKLGNLFYCMDNTFSDQHPVAKQVDPHGACYTVRAVRLNGVAYESRFDAIRKIIKGQALSIFPDAKSICAEFERALLLIQLYRGLYVAKEIYENMEQGKQAGIYRKSNIDKAVKYAQKAMIKLGYSREQAFSMMERFAFPDRDHMEQIKSIQKWANGVIDQMLACLDVKAHDFKAKPANIARAPV